MARNNGRHRISRRTKIATGAIGLAIAVGALVVTTTAGDPAAARADGADKSLFVDIQTVKPNVRTPREQGDATTGTFTVNCGRNENEHFNPDNFIAQPGVRNGAQHLHDYVGNLSTNADSNNKSLQKAGTTCKNGDKSAYFWPVIRINDPNAGQNAGGAAKNNQADAKKQQRKAQQQQDKQAKEAPRVDCKDVASELPEENSDQAQAEVEKELANMEKQIEEADKKLANAKDVESEVLAPLEDKRKASLDRIDTVLARDGADTPNLGELAPCEIKDQQNAGVDNGDENSDNAQADGLADKANKAQPDENANNELEGNEGEIQRPEKAELEFRGNPAGKVTAMPKFLRVLYGDAKVSANGTKNAKDSWTCTGFEDRVLINKYPICPQGSKVKRIHDFPSCWDGKNIDSKNHRDHIVDPDQNGKCKRGFKAVPQLRVSLTYNIPQDVQQAGAYAVDSFPEEEHDPLTDHDDFANVMSQNIMSRVVNCINKDKTCRE
jgi:hypothetical protein